MSFNSIQYKLNKYENKMRIESNQYKKALYAQKVSHYQTLVGGGPSDIIAVSEKAIMKLLETHKASTSGTTELVNNLKKKITELTNEQFKIQLQLIELHKKIKYQLDNSSVVYVPEEDNSQIITNIEELFGKLSDMDYKFNKNIILSN